MSNASSDTPEQVTSGKPKLPPLNAWWVAPLSIFAVGFIYFASQVMGGIIVYLYPQAQHWTTSQINDWLNQSVTAQFFYILIAEALTMLGIWGMLKTYRWSWATIGLYRPKLKHIAIGLAATVPYYVLYILMVVLVSAVVPSFKADQEQQIGFNSVHGLIPLLLTFISLVVLPPLVEEIAMRGFLYTSLKKWFSWIVSALLVSALFGMAHLAEGGDAGPLWIGALDTFVLSLVLCYLREKTGNLWAGITLHATKNGVAFISLFILGSR